MEPDELEAIDTSSGDESAGLNMSAPSQLSQPTPMENDGSQYAQDPAGGDRQAFHDPKYFQGMGRRGAQITDLPPAPQQEAIPTMDGPSNPTDPIRHVRSGVKSLVGYLMGNTEDPTIIDRAAQQVDPQGQRSPADRNAAAVAHVAETQGDEAAWKLAQANRAAYNAKQAFAYTALNGTPQKPPDLAAAVKAANQAQENVLDGQNVTFSPRPGGVTATVSDGSGTPRQIELSIGAFREFLNVGKTGMLDRLLDKGTGALLDQLAQQSGSQTKRIKPGARREAIGEGVEPVNPAEPVAESNFGKTPSTMNLSGNKNIQYGSNEQKPYEQMSLDERAMKTFPSYSQNDQREQWKASERAREGDQKNKLDIANVRVDVAEQNANARVKAAETAAAAARDVATTKQQGYVIRDQRKAQIEAAKLEMRAKELATRSNDRRIHEQASQIKAMLLAGKPLKPEHKAVFDKLMGNDGRGVFEEVQMDAPQTQPAQPQPQKQSGNQSKAMSAKDQQAAAWANANPQDPRAAKIKAQLGIQ